MDLNFIPLIPLWLIILGLTLAVIAAAFSAILVFNRPRSRTASLISFGLRLGALIMLGFFALQPHSKKEVSRIGDRPVAILIDVSDSMLLDDGSGEGKSRLEHGTELLGEVKNAVKNAGGESVSFAFAGNVIPLSGNFDPENVPTILSRDTTDLEHALDGIGNPAAAVVISDAVFDRTANTQFPIFFLNPTGGPTPGSCWVLSATAPSRVLPGSPFPIEVTYRSTSDDAVSFEIYEDDRKVASGNGPSRHGANRVTLEITENDPGRHFYRIAGIPGDSKSYATTEVVRGPLTVSYFAHSVDYDTAYLRRGMDSNEAVELTYSAVIGGGSKINPEDLVYTDVIVLANPSGKSIDHRLAGAIEKRVAEGAGLLFLFSTSTPDRWGSETGALGALMPLTGGNPKTPLVGGSPVSAPSATPDGFGSGTIPNFTHIWDMGYPKPGTSVIWSSNGVPVLTAMRYGKGRVMLLTGGGFYRWENARADEAPGLEQVAADLVLYLSESADDGIAISDNLVEIGKTITISAKAEEEPGFIMTGPDDIPIQLSPLEIEPGLWRAEFSPETIGEYALTARRFEGEGLLVDKESVLAVKPTNEKRAGFPGVDTMRTLGSGVFAGSEIPALEKELKSALLETGPETSETRNEPVLPNWIALGVFIVLLLAEWTSRRLLGLA